MTFSGQPNDTMVIRLTNGITTVDLERIAPDDASIGIWQGSSFPIQSFITPTANMQLSVEVNDNPTVSITGDSVVCAGTKAKLKAIGTGTFAYPKSN